MRGPLTGGPSKSLGSSLPLPCFPPPAPSAPPTPSSLQKPIKYSHIFEPRSFKI